MVSEAFCFVKSDVQTTSDSPIVLLDNPIVPFLACRGRHGFVVAVTGIDSVGAGMLRDGTGYVSFPVRYQAVVFRPFKDEILECVVTTVNNVCRPDYA